jgi:hypothetical protein
MLRRFWNVMNPQTRIIVVTATALVAIDIALRLLIPTRVIQVNNATISNNGSNGGVLTVRALQLADDNGNIKATLDLDENNEPALKMYDANDSLRLQLDTLQTVPSLMFFDQNDSRTMYLGNGSPDGETYLDTNTVGDIRAIEADHISIRMQSTNSADSPKCGNSQMFR